MINGSPKIGMLVQSSLDNLDRGNLPLAFASASMALVQTVQKVAGKDEVSDFQLRKYLQSNWEAFSFGIQKALQLPLNVPFGIKRIFPEFNSLSSFEETVVFLVLKTAGLGRLPSGCETGSGEVFEIKDEKLYVPHGLIYSMLALCIFDPVNEGEEIQERAWFNFGGFQMFVTELWGRQDLLQRVIRYHTEK